MKTIAWHLVGSPLILAIMTIIRSCLCSNLRAERAKNVLTPELAPRLIHQPAVTTEPHFTCGTPSPCHRTRLPPCPGTYFCAVESAILGTQGMAPCLSLPPFCFAWCPLSLGIQASENSCSRYPCLQLLLENRAAGFSGAPSQDWLFFSFILENLVGLCQLWAQCQLPLVCPWCFCLGTLCTHSPAESHAPDCNPVILFDGFSHYPVLFVPSWVTFSHSSASAWICLSSCPTWEGFHLRRGNDVGDDNVVDKDYQLLNTNNVPGLMIYGLQQLYLMLQNACKILLSFCR